MQHTRRTFLQAAFGSILRGQIRDARPNLVFIISDDLGWNDVGYHNPQVNTPNLDRLCARGVRMTQYRTNSVCSPTRASLLTGRTAFRVGVPSPIPQANALPITEKLLPQMLTEAGYQSWLVGKWHLGEIAPQYLPHRRGFQHHYGYLGGTLDYYEHTFMNREDWYLNGEKIKEQGYSTDLLTAEAIRLIRERDKFKPFFLDLSFNAPHVPLQVPVEYLTSYSHIADPNRRTFLAMIEAMDAAIGRVYSTLEEQGIAENTLFVWVSDNGGQTTMNAGGNNDPLRGMKGQGFDGGLRVPAFMLWPQGLEGGWVFDRLFTVLDWMPTLADAIGFPLDPTIERDGMSRWRYLHDGVGSEHDPVILGGGNNFAVFKGDWKLVEQSAPNMPAQRYLFRIYEDPSEQRDLSAQFPEVFNELLAILRAQPIGTPDRLA